MKQFSPNQFRSYSQEDVSRLQGSVHIEHSIAKLGAERMWSLLNTEPYVKALGCLTGGQAINMVRAGVKAIYASGWQLSSEPTINEAGQLYPDMSLYPINSMPRLVAGINAALLRTDQIEVSEQGQATRNWLAPIIADIESGFTGSLATFELTKSMIKSGVAFVHLEDQMPNKLCGHLANKVLIPTRTFIKNITAARLAADVCGVPTGLIARTDALSAGFITSDASEIDHPFIDFDRRTDDGFFHLKGDPMERCIVRGLAYADYCDALWFETSTPDYVQAKEFADAIHAKYPNFLLSYNCSPSFNWKKYLSDVEIASFQEKLADLGYRYQFITLAGYHSMNAAMFELALDYKDNSMSAYVKLQEHEFELQSKGYTAVKHQHESGVGYYDLVKQTIDGNNNLSALTSSTEFKQF